MVGDVERFEEENDEVEEKGGEPVIGFRLSPQGQEQFN